MFIFAKIVGGGKFGNALDPVPGYVEFDDSNMLTGNALRTVSAWVKLESIPQSHGSVIEWGTQAETQKFGIIVSPGGKAFSVGEMADMESDGAIF